MNKLNKSIIYKGFKKVLIEKYGNLACPLHDTAKKIGIEEIAQVVCAMDKAYMTGFKNINYTRTTSVAEGDRCCNYRLTYDKSKR